MMPTVKMDRLGKKPKVGDQTTVDDVVERRNHRLHIRTLASTNEATTDFSSHSMDLYKVSSPRKLVQCRIFHDEDQDSSVEVHCGCRGSLKYAHRKCDPKKMVIRRWDSDAFM
ncbi:putative E3 ubiquitin-protein ligase MARCH [Helianthus annuus]|nr:putative E3 ubiquitin-protein ligase MARCH [Helianthus annuus]